MKYEPLHPIVFFIADRPSKKNVSQSIPMVGTQSYRNFLQWLAFMHIDCTRIKIFNRSDNPFPKESEAFLKKIKIVALGSKAKDYLLKTGIDEFFVLPHPSPKNFQLNDSKRLKEKLLQCKDYIYNK